MKHLPNILLFLETLRAEGLLVSPAEAGSLLPLLTADMLADRARLHGVMRAMLAKSPKEQSAFDRAFRDFFIGEEHMAQQVRERQAEEAERQQQVESGRENLGQDIPEELAEAYAKASEARQALLRSMLASSQAGGRNNELMKAYLNKLARGWLSEEGGYGMEPFTEQEDSLLHKDLTQISEEETSQALHLIEQLVQRLNRNAERRSRRQGRHGQPDVRATIHTSLRTGGVPMKPIYKKRPRPSHSFVLLCDVSESMYRFSGFALRFITAIGRGGRARAFLFSEGLEEIGFSDYARFEARVRSSALWRRGTDIGGAL
ncbi:MAG: VWA domain-containing protein, partial [Clostridiales Family XIII bacterium]|nr:VWA domain-containing protein [Clostridiales Family XIII bacterium]